MNFQWSLSFLFIDWCRCFIKRNHVILCHDIGVRFSQLHFTVGRNFRFNVCEPFQLEFLWVRVTQLCLRLDVLRSQFTSFRCWWLRNFFSILFPLLSSKLIFLINFWSSDITIGSWNNTLNWCWWSISFTISSISFYSFQIICIFFLANITFVILLDCEFSSLLKYLWKRNQS